MCRTTEQGFACDDHGISRREFARFAARMTAAAAGIGFLSGCERQQQPTTKKASDGKKRTGLKIGYLPITDATPLLIAHAKGYFQEEGIDAEKPSLVRTWSQLAESFLAGSFNLVHLLMPIPIYMRFSQKHPVKVVAWNHINGSALTISGKSTAKSIGELGGKQIAVPYWYSIHNVILQGALQAQGLEAVIQDRQMPLGPKQVNLFVMAPPDMPTGLANGSIDGYIVAEPFNAAGEVLADGRLLRFSGDIFRNHPCCVATMHERDINDDPDFAQAVLNALVKAQKWITQNRSETAVILSKQGSGYLPQEQMVIDRAMNYYDLGFYGPTGTGAIRHPDWKTNRIGFNPYPYESATREIVKLLKNTKVEGDSAFLSNLEPEKVVQELFNYALVRHAVEKHGGMSGFDGVTGGDGFKREELIGY